MTPNELTQEEAKAYADMRFMGSNRANGEAWVISYTSYLDAMNAEKLRSSKLLEALKEIRDMETSGSRFDILKIVNSTLSAYKS